MQFTWLWAFFRFKFPDETFQEKSHDTSFALMEWSLYGMECRWIGLFSGCNADPSAVLFAETIYANNKTEYSELLDTKIWNSKRSRARKAGGRYDIGILSLFKTNLSLEQICQFSDLICYRPLYACQLFEL